MDNQIKPAMATSSCRGKNQMGNYRSSAMTKRRVVDGRMITTTDTRCTIRPINTEDKYAFVLKLCAHISGCTVEQVDAQIVKVMSEQP